MGLDLVYRRRYHADAITCRWGRTPAECRLLDVPGRPGQAIVSAAGNPLGGISPACRLPRSHGFGVVRAFVGHGIGRNLHEEPQIPEQSAG